MPDAHMTCIDLWCKAGSSNEDIGEEGMAHFLEHMIFKGSHFYEAGEFDRHIESLGGSSNAATGFDDVHFHVLVPSNELEPACQALLDLVLNPAIRTIDYEMEREVVLEEIAQHNDQPDEKVFQALLEVCWKNHSYSNPILGLKESLIKNTPNDMKKFHSKMYIPSNCCLSIAGPYDSGIKKIINNSLLARTNLNNQDIIPYKKIKKPRFNKGRRLIKIPRLEVPRLIMAWPASCANQQMKLMGEDIGTSILADGMSSRLVKHLREELKIVESIEMDITALEHGGLIILEACCKEKNIKYLEKEIAKILFDALYEEIQIEELKRSIKLIKNGFYFSLESTSQVASLAGSNTLWGRNQKLLDPLNYIELWNEDKLKEQVFSLLQPENCFTLIAIPD